MAIKYYSDVLKKYFDSEEKCVSAEKEFEIKEAEKKAAQEAKLAERKAAAQIVEEKQKAAIEAKKEYNDALNDFCKKYGSFHTTISNEDIKRWNENYFNDFFDFLLF